MNAKKVMAGVLASAMILGACPAVYAEDTTHIYVLTASEDHGWTGSVATFAKEKAEEINEEGTYVAFDRIIEAVSDTAVSNVKGDNTGIGAGAAAYFVSLGLKPGDAVYVYEGDTSSVTTLRDAGFTDYLTGKIEFEGSLIAEEDMWTEEDLASITYSGAMNWSRSDTKTSFESLMGDESNADIKWFYAEDDELAMGILEALNGGGIDDTTKEKFLSNRPVITGCGGLVSVTYSPAMIQTAIEDMVAYLNGEEVEQDHVIPCENVTSENVENYPSF